MQLSTLLKRNLTYYWRTNLAVVLGVATAVAVLAGALLVGDSVRASLRDLLLLRLGNTDQVISSAGFFREQLTNDMQAHTQFASTFSAACPLVVLDGTVTHDKSNRRAAGVQVYGVDERFWKFHGRDGADYTLNPRQLLLSAGLAQELGAEVEDAILVRVEKHSDIPVESLHGRKEDLGITMRLTTRAVLPASALGEFSIRPQQAAVRAVFVPLRRLQQDLDQDGKVNTILLAEKNREANPQIALEASEKLLRDAFSLADVGLKVNALAEQRRLLLESDSAIINDELANTARQTAESLSLRVYSVLTYLANTMRVGQREVPYSLITALNEEGFDFSRKGTSTLPPMILNEWAARDLAAKPGDTLSFDYYLWEQEGRLTTRTAQFEVTGIVPIAGAAADRRFAPTYPGITESASLSDWDPPFPMDLKRVRPIDEEYWHQYRTTPKAFIRLEDGQKLWGSRFGKLTSLRLAPAEGSNLQTTLDAYQTKLKAALDPLKMGFSVYSARAQGLAASRGATDFGEYFVYFSFFLVVSALMLTGLFFKLGVEQRLREIGLLRAIGFPAAQIRALFVREGFALAVIGSIVGVGGAVGYGELMMFGLRTWWVGAVGTTSLTLHISPTSLVIGAVGGVLTAVGCIVWSLRLLAPTSPRSLLMGVASSEPEDRKDKRSSWRQRLAALPFSASRLAIICGLIGTVMLVSATLKLIGQVAGFFGAGTLLLVALLCFQAARLKNAKKKLIQGSGWWAVARLGFRNAAYRPGRSVLCIALIASATFIIVAVGAFRRDSQETVLEKKSGNGGFPLLAESLLPVTYDPNSAEGRAALNLPALEDSAMGRVSFARFRVRPGDDASCLNLYQPRNPKILAPTTDFIQSGRFAFQDSLASTPEEKANPWLLLNQAASDGAVPVIADANSLTYVLHLKLGDELTLHQNSGQAIRLRVVAALADSIFQSELLMSEKNFLRSFPSEEGYRFFLLDAPPEKVSAVTTTLEERLADFGFDVRETEERLASFHRVENTYLSTFQSLGGLGLLLGTLGLATVLLRNVLERRRELALLRAVGYNSSHFTIMVLAENALLLCGGLVTGSACALLAIAPTLLARGGQLPTVALGVLLLAVMVAGLTASLAATIAAWRAPLIPTLRAE